MTAEPATIPQMQAHDIPSTAAPTAALYFISDEYKSEGRAQLMGRNVASEEFAKALARYTRADRLFCFTQNATMFQDFTRRIAALSPTPKQVNFIPPNALHQLEDAGTLMVPGPGVDRHAWLRRRIGQRSYSLCGVTHTIASDRVMDAFGQFMIAPVQPWDAVICTSQVVRDSIEHLLVNWGEYLASRFGLKDFVRPTLQLPVIPLGIHCDDFADTPDRQAAGGMWRSKLKIGADDVAVLYVGRLSPHAKAHPLPMFIALEKAAKQTRKKIHLILAGWFANKALEQAFVEGVHRYCPNINVHMVDGRSGDVRRNIWHAADIFCSLSDNIQETFGLTPIEAKAAGLPVVVTDWNGYRETIRDGEDGIRVPTLTQAPGRGEELARRYEADVDNYDLYCANASQATSVDIERTAQAFVQLIVNKGMRQQMGEAGQRHAREAFDWQAIIPQYEALWHELGELRRNAPEVAARQGPESPANPLRDDPFTLFAPYPTAVLQPKMKVALKESVTPQVYRQNREMAMNRYGTLASHEEAEAIIEALAHEGPTSVRDITRAFGGDKAMLIERTLLWMAKANLVSIGDHNKPS